jgi:hypothetical protein
MLEESIAALTACKFTVGQRCRDDLYVITALGLEEATLTPIIVLRADVLPSISWVCPLERLDIREGLTQGVWVVIQSWTRLDRCGVLVNRSYQHYRGNMYRVIALAIHEKTFEPVVVYTSENSSEPTTWVRPLTSFVEWIDDCPRFQLVAIK